MPAIFYVIMAAAGLNLGTLRSTGWIFDMGDGGREPWYAFYSYFGKWYPFLQAEHKDLTVMWQITTLLCLLPCGLPFRPNLHCEWSFSNIHDKLIAIYRLFFNVLHPPLNVPALGKEFSQTLAF